jgi:hypothetical protein
MDREEAKKLQTEWGDKPCKHPDIIEESEITVERWRCVQCGRLVAFAEWRKTHKGPSMPPTDPRD